ARPSAKSRDGAGGAGGDGPSARGRWRAPANLPADSRYVAADRPGSQASDDRGRGVRIFRSVVTGDRRRRPARRQIWTAGNHHRLTRTFHSFHKTRSQRRTLVFAYTFGGRRRSFPRARNGRFPARLAALSEARASSRASLAP